MNRHGFSLVEVVVATTLLAFAGLASVALIQTSRDGAHQASGQAARTGWLRRASMRLREDVEQTTSARLTIATLADQNHSITLQRPVAVSGGIPTWGAYDLGQATRLRPGHFTRFTVVAGPGGRRLLRQLLAPSLVVLHEEVIAVGLAAGTANPPGLRIVPSGALWQVTIGLASTGSRPGEAMTFDVALNN